MKANTRFFDGEAHPEYDSTNPNHAIGDKEIINLAKTKNIGSVLWGLTKGCMDYYNTSMTVDVPEDWVKDLHDYYSDKYPFNRFVKTVFDRCPGAKVPTSLFKDIWKHWATSAEYEGEDKLEGVYKLNKAMINNKLVKEMGYKIQKLTIDGKRQEVLVDFKLTDPFEQMFGEDNHCDIGLDM